MSAKGVSEIILRVLPKKKVMRKIEVMAAVFV
jgi:hypothetical protein